MAVYYEARGEPTAGQQHVASVVWNRVEKYNNNPYNSDNANSCEIIAAKRQFDFYLIFEWPPMDGVAWNKAVEAAKRTRYNRTTPSTHYATEGLLDRYGLKKLEKVGNHVFYD